MTDPDENVVPFTRARGKRRPRAAAPTPDVAPKDADPLFEVPATPETTALVSPAPMDALFEPAPTKPRPRAKAPAPRPRSKPRPPRTPEDARALEIARSYKAKQPVCNVTRVAEAIETAVGTWSDEEIVAAVERLVRNPYGVTENTLRIELMKTREKPAREIDPVIHQAIDAALEHLGRLDSETMTEAEQALGAAIRQVCVAVMHKAADAAAQ